MNEASISSGPDLYSSAEKFVVWLEKQVVAAGRGDRESVLSVDPSGKFWLGRLAPEEKVQRSVLADRGERLDPCALGIRLKPEAIGPWELTTIVSFKIWLRNPSGSWFKSEEVRKSFSMTVPRTLGEHNFGRHIIEQECADLNLTGYSAEVRVEVSRTFDRDIELSVCLVNTTPERVRGLADTNLYESVLSLSGLVTKPFLLESLPDSFRYDRRVKAYGINCGVELQDGQFFTTDTTSVNKCRPSFWNSSRPIPDFRFEALASDPLTSPRMLLEALDEWGNEFWGLSRLRQRGTLESWTDEMRQEAEQGAREFTEEVERIAAGVRLLEQNQNLQTSFRLMNEAMHISAAGKYDSWRPFQIGFLLANLNSILDQSDRQTVDIVWFATGGGKTETYLGLLATAAFHDRITGKLSGVTAWSRFPLRMLSLQQTQRFANVMAAAEQVRLKEELDGDEFSVGFFVGRESTPNSIEVDAKEGNPDPDNPNMPAGYKVLLECPFCRTQKLSMTFDREFWRLLHQCLNPECSRYGRGLPFYIVDDEIYRFLPTIVVGTLDKAASVSMQASMRGLIGAPLGRCPKVGHGYTYAPRSRRPGGCLVPGCDAAGPLALPIGEKLFGPSFRLQDELHLLRDSLGAVDSHYESLLDHLQTSICGRSPKILASSATLTGYEKQVATIYARSARVFPAPGPSVQEGFWTADSELIMRRYVGLAPRGLTLEYAIDRMLTELQQSVRDFLEDPTPVCNELQIPVEHVEPLVSLYGTDVVYGNTLRDLDAVIRSIETQIRVTGRLKTASLTGKTDFAEVRKILTELEAPASSFEDRLHIIAASSMMSHGVDLDRLNVMCVLGHPLATAEFLQATARVGRRWPGIVFVAHKIGRERDAGIFRSFSKYIEQADRFVEAIPVTRRSRRVLERTIAGMMLARIVMIHEPASGGSLAVIPRLRDYFRRAGITVDTEFNELVHALELDDELDSHARADIRAWLENFFQTLAAPGANDKFPADLSPSGPPMISLRDVEEQVKIFGSEL